MKTTFTITSSNGIITADKRSGKVISIEEYPGDCDDPYFKTISKFDVAEYSRFYSAGIPDSVDILDLGYFYEGKKGTSYEEPAHDWREDVKSLRIGLVSKTTKACIHVRIKKHTNSNNSITKIVDAHIADLKQKVVNLIYIESNGRLNVFFITKRFQVLVATINPANGSAMLMDNHVAPYYEDEIRNQAKNIHSDYNYALN